MALAAAARRADQNVSEGRGWEIEDSSEAVRGRETYCELGAGDVVPVDAEVVDGTARVDESAVTGESAPVLRAAEPGRRSVLAGSRVEAGRIRIRPLAIPLYQGRPRPRVPSWWPVAALAVAAALSLLTARWSGWPRAVFLALLMPPYLLLLSSGVAEQGEGTFWRRMRVRPLDAAALARAARCDTLLLCGGAVDDEGRLSAVELHPLPGVTVEELATAAHQANARAEGGARRSVYILARRMAAEGEGVCGDDPLCAPVSDVVREIAERGGCWPEAARQIEGGILSRGDECLAVADGGRPLGLIELRTAAHSPTLDDTMRAGIMLAIVDDASDLRERLRDLQRARAQYAVAWDAGLVGEPPPGSRFTMAGTAWAASHPTVLDLDANPAKLPGLLLAARRVWRRAHVRGLVAGAADLWRAGAVVPACLAALRGPIHPVVGGPAAAGLALLAVVTVLLAATGFPRARS